MRNEDIAKQRIREFIQIKDLNLELLDVLTTIMKWFIEFHKKTRIDIPHIDALYALTDKAHTLLREIDSPPFLQHRKQTPEDATEPQN